MPSTLPDLLCRLATIALRAGHEIMTIYGSNVTAREKADLSPVTEADEAAERLILRDLAATDPDIPVISEEAASAGHIPKTAGLFYLVDPLDGTKEFLTRNGEFTVNIGLIRDGRPVAGVVYAPAKGEIFVGEVGRGAWSAAVNGEASLDTLDWVPIRTRTRNSLGARRRRQPLSHGHQDRSLAQSEGTPQTQERRFVAQILPPCQG